MWAGNLSGHVWEAGVEVGDAICKGAKEPLEVSHPKGETTREAQASLGSGL